MLQGKRTRKAIAATLLVILTTNILAPGISYALTSGPTQPEATSFEPVDTTDMVNLFTGSLTYNIPVMDVPGPEGGYPLALSYHAGIQPNEDASWVGLGWDLNAGAISRSVNGYPDEWLGVNNTSHVYWAGGTTSTFSIGVSLPVAGAAGVSFGLSFSQDTYQGFGIGWSEGADFGLSNTPLKVSAEVGVTPYGTPFAGVGVGARFGGKDGGLTGSLGINFSTDFNGNNSMGFSGGVGYSFAHHGDPGHPHQATNFSLLGASIGTGSDKPSLSVGGLMSSISSTSQAQIQTTSSGWSLSGFGLPISLGYNKTRYYIDQLTNVNTFGCLSNYGWTTNGDKSLADNTAFDTYSLLESPADKNFTAYPDPTVLQGGAFDDFDRYQVVAQGVGGTIRPYKFLGQSRGENRKNSDGSYRVKYFSPSRPGPLSNADQMPQFRFAGDFSNSYRQAYPSYNAGDLSASPAGSLVLPFDPSPIYGNNDGTYGYDPNQNILAGSRSVTVGTSINPSFALGYPLPNGNPAGTINGFTILNESGVKYTFGLPAYSSGEEVYQEKIDRSGGLSYNRQKKNTPYAYTWYLTTITGPDYVDRNNNQVADDGDWGYWVNFEYGKWSGSYVWRNPSEGYNIDEDDTWKDCSTGVREVYYLNAIRTRSHVALFEKDIRADAKGESISAFAQNSDGSYTNSGLFDNSSTSSMKLSHIYLLNSADENFVSPASGTLNANVLDRTDVDAVGRANLEAKALRVIDFNYDYSLCPGTTNSFNTPGSPQGKLTLLSLVTRGKGGANITPPNQFQYDLGSTAVSQSVSLTGVAGTTPASFTTSNGNFNVGDMIQCSSPSVYCGVVTAKTPGSGNFTYTLANCNYTGGTITATVTTTKNPPYNKDFYDVWGLYKSDADLSLIVHGATFYRNATLVSGPGTDAWSLRRIVSPLGSTVNVGYEPNMVKGSVATSDMPIMSSFMVSDQAAGSSPVTQVKFRLSTNQANWSFSSPPQAGMQGQLILQSTLTVLGGGPDGHTTTFHYASGLLAFTVTQVDADGTIHATISPGYSPGSATIDGGLIFFNNAVNYVGGGTRIRSVSLQNSATSEVYTTSYSYTIPNSSLTSGVSSYSPTGLDVGTAIFAVRDAYFNQIAPIYSMARELPPPGAMYEYVTVTKQIQNPDENGTIRTLPGSTRFQYEVFRSNMVGRIEVNPRQSGVYSGLNQYARYYAFDKFTSCLGNVKRVVQFDDKGNKLSETINNYLHDNLIGEPLQNFMTDYKNLLSQYAYQGYIQERFAEIKQVNNQDPTPADISAKATITAREEFPTIQTSQTVINYVNGTQTTSQNKAFDFYSGAVTETVETDAYGNNFRTDVVPAYRESQYASMGVQIGNSNGPNFRYANMLTQAAYKKTYKVDANNNPLGLVSASATTWSNSVPAMGPDGTIYAQNGSGAGTVWRPQYVYDWMPPGTTSDGLTLTSNFSDFDFGTLSSSDTRWAKTSEMTLYDVYSKALEAKDINGNYAATRLNYGEQKVILAGGPANYYEIAYSGAEDAAVSQANAIFVQAADGTVSSATAHTGANSLLLGASGKRGFLYSVPIVSSGTGGVKAGRSYTAAVWVKPASGSMSGVKLYYSVGGTVKGSSSGTSTKTAGAWSLVNLTINGSDLTSGSTLAVWCQNDNGSVQAYVDDMRFQPLNAATTAYVYDPFSGELTHSLDNNNLYTRFEYDAMGHLVRTYKEKLSIGEFKTNQYQYNYSTSKAGNAAVASYFSKNNCTVGGQQGTSAYVTIPQNTYFSFLGQQDADATAALYAQDYANTHGSCVCMATFNSTYSSGVGATLSTSGNVATFSFTFTFPQTSAPGANADLGNIVGACAIPSSTRTVPITASNGSIYNVIIYPSGFVQVILQSGTPPTGTMTLQSAYGLTTALAYSQPTSAEYLEQCPAGQVGDDIIYSVPLGKFYAADATTAQNLAIAYRNQMGQATANQGTCYVNCPFNWDQSLGGFTSPSKVTGGQNNTVNFSFNWTYPTSTYTGGTIGTITGGCLPSVTRTVNVTNSASGASWSVTITPSGTVTATQHTGPTGQQGQPIKLSSSFNL